MSGIERIAAERQRQIEAEGWTPEHDDQHDSGELAQAACVYATDPATRAAIMLTPDGEANVNIPGSGYEPRHWPWDGWWKPEPNDRIKELTKAGALIAAEIDRLERGGAKCPEDDALDRLDYWDTIEAALTTIPESSPYRETALRSLDHLKERVLTNHATVREALERLREERDAAWFEERRGVDAAGNPTVSVWCRRCGVEHQRPEHCPSRPESAEAEVRQLREALARVRPDIDPETGYGYRESV